ncbi:MAG: LexA family transcriptional regulator [Saprospiraceae bacterium]|nr:LexA family transcriptional regulator [Saprospiraceae bacterium]MBK7810624.1 LexA family transcriptional regulator [Saprospiraceae bacterium]MBK9630216.1 LexA family transcriptional regulator [Saprospiraceae bacterium]
MFFDQNIRFLRQKYQLSQQEASEHLEIPRTTLGDYERGHTEPNIETLLKIAELYEVSVELLLRFDLTEDGTEVYDKKGFKILSTTVDSKGRSNIELVRSKAHAGYLESFDDPEFIRELPKLHVPGFKGGSWFRAFEITGDSMAPMESGTLIICSYVEKLKDIKAGKTYVVVSRQNGLVYKRVFPELKSKSLLLKSDNPIYPPAHLALEDLTEIWQYEAHLSFVDPNQSFQTWSQSQNDSIIEKLDEIQRDVRKMLAN